MLKESNILSGPRASYRMQALNLRIVWLYTTLEGN